MGKYAKTAVVGEGVVFLGTAQLDEFVIVGRPKRTGEVVETLIGDGAVLRSGTVVYAGNRIGRNFQTGHGALIRHGNVIGDDCSLGSSSVIEFESRIGRGVRIHSQAFIPEYSTLEDECWIGPNAVLTNARYPRSSKAKEFLQGVTIERRAKIGANATVLPGIVVGADALVGAGAVVTKDVPAGAVVVGNPAKVMKGIEDLEYADLGIKAYPSAPPAGGSLGVPAKTPDSWRDPWKLEVAGHEQLWSLHQNLRRELMARWQRRVPFADELFDRWERAAFLGFGTGASIYDSSLVLGDVRVGEETWIGPSTVLDGLGGLVVGKYCSISAGVQLYSHDTVEWALSGGKRPQERQPTRVGDCCYVGPMTIVAKGVTIGEHSVIGANSLVLRDVPPFSIAIGTPARVVGRVELGDDSRVHLVYDERQDAPEENR